VEYATVGWRRERLDEAQAEVENSANRRQLYDTTLTGYGKGGHRFGEDLSPAEVKQLLEYLKML